ncbi:MAG: hypothetical protein WCX77_00860 [Candidatus Paceibacterota bacterium]
MPKLKITFLIFIGLMAVLLVSNWASTSYLKNQIKKIQPQNGEDQTSSASSTPLSIEEIIKESSYKTLKTADQKLSIKCPIDWVEIGEEKILKYFDAETVSRYQIKIPLAAVKKDGAQLMVTEIFMDSTSTLKDALSANEEIYKKTGQDVNILLQSEKEKELYFEAEYTQKEEKMTSQEKILETADDQEKKHFYIVSVVVPSDLSKNYQETGSEMLSSIQINN